MKTDTMTKERHSKKKRYKIEATTKRIVCQRCEYNNLI